METSPFPPARPASARITFTTDPARNALVSLSLLTAPPDASEGSPWVARAAARLTPAQRLNNRVVFERFGADCLAVKDAADMPAYLGALARTHPALLRDLAKPVPPGLDDDVLRAAAAVGEDGVALRAFLVSHLRALWESELSAEWAAAGPPLLGLTVALSQRHPGAGGPAGAVLRAVLKRDIPDGVHAAIAGVQEIVFVLSPHATLWVDRFGEPDRARVFARFEPGMLRQAPIRRAEVVGALSALADDTRLGLLEILAAAGETRAQDLVVQLGVSQPNVSRHLKQLVGAGLVLERRAGDANKLYRHSPGGLDAALFKLSQLLEADNARANRALAGAGAAREAALAGQAPDLRPFLDDAGRIAHFSTKRAEQALVLAYLLGKIAPKHEYTEKEITALIASWIAPQPGRFGIDAVTLRRALVEESALRRTAGGSKYWREGG